MRRFSLRDRDALLTLAEVSIGSLVKPVIRRVRRRNDLVAFGAPLDRFADNSAYLFLHLAHAVDMQVSPVWISGSRSVVSRLSELGLDARHRWSPGGLSAAVRAGVYVYAAYPSDINRWLVFGARTVCLWHGLPLKRIERDLPRPPTPSSALGRAHERLLRPRRPVPDFVLSSSTFITTTCVESAFGIPADRCIEVGYPRNDHLTTAPARLPDPAFGVDQTVHDRLSEGTVVGVFLTWRDDRLTDVAADDGLLAALAKECVARGATLAYKTHYNVRAPDGLPESCVVLPTEVDLNAYLGLCDVLVTDYSSISFDFMLLNRPILLYLPDLESYQRTRGLYFDPLAFPVPVSTTVHGLLSDLGAALTSLSAGEQAHASYDAWRAQMWGGYSGTAAEDLSRRLFRPE